MNMNPQKSSHPKFVLGSAELEVLKILNTPMKLEKILSHLLKKEIVTSRYSAEKVIQTLQRKGFLKENQEEIKVTEAGGLLQSVLMLTGVIKEE